ncbi:hypothetical protein PGB90_003164 [Kerria lacca]
MSLYNTLDIWSTRCGEDESFGFDSLIISNLNENSHDLIIVGSFQGLLRIYQVINNENEQYNFKPSDLLLEIQLPGSIVQIVTGKLISGSRDSHIGVALSASINVYSFSSIPGSTEHGNQFELKLIYEHPLQHINYQLIIGPFGGIKGRDFLCAVAVDGTLTFFEQESFIFQTHLPTFLLPSPIVYVAESDLFVTLSANWYQDLVNTTKKKFSPTWTHNLGENLIGIQKIKHPLQKEVFIVALSEYNVTCFGDNGCVKFTKRLQYIPICFYIYLNESNNNLMILIASDCGTLFVYERMTLLWSAKLPFVPVCISRAKIIVSGSLVILSDKGDLKCCYLGTKPSLFIAPTFNNSISTDKNTKVKLETLQEEIKNLKKKNLDSLTLEITEQELMVMLKVVPFDKSLKQCQVVVELVPSCPLTNVHVVFKVAVPLCINPKTFILSSLCEKSLLDAYITINENKNIVVSSLNVTAVVTYMVNNIPRVIRKQTNISSRFVLLPCIVSEDKCRFKICVRTHKVPALLTTLFQEYKDDKWLENTCSDETASFCLRYNSDKKCTVSLMKSEYGYEFIGNSIPLIQLLLTQITYKYKSLKSSSDKNQNKFFFDCKFVLREELIKAVTSHVVTRNEINNLLIFLEKLSAQYRLIQRRLLVKLKDKVFSNISAIQMLYHDTYEKIIETIRSVEEKQTNLIELSSELQSILDITFDLMLLNSAISSEKVSLLRNAMSSTDLNTDVQGWEERTNANLIHLLRTTLSNNDRDQHRIISQPNEMITNPVSLENLIITAIERVTGDKYAKSELNRITPILEDDEFDENQITNPKCKFFKHEKLLSKRQTYDDDPTHIADKFIDNGSSDDLYDI